MMNTTPTPTAKQVKKLTLDIVDEAAVIAAYPEVVEQKPTINRQKLYPIVKALHGVGRQVPGVHAYYAHELPSPSSDTTEGKSTQLKTTGTPTMGEAGPHTVEAEENELRHVPGAVAGKPAGAAA